MAESPFGGAMLRPIFANRRSVAREMVGIGSAMRAALLSFVIVLAVGFSAHASSVEEDALLKSLIGKTEAAVLARVGPPDETERNGVQTFFRYRAFDARRTGVGRDPYGFAHGLKGSLGFRGTASFDCQTTLVLTDGTLTAYSRSGIGC